MPYTPYIDPPASPQHEGSGVAGKLALLVLILSRRLRYAFGLLSVVVVVAGLIFAATGNGAGVFVLGVFGLGVWLIAVVGAWLLRIVIEGAGELLK